MRIHACHLAAGDVLKLNDWHLHVVAVEPGQTVGVATSEFDFLIHFRSDEVVEVQVRRGCVAA